MKYVIILLLFLTIGCGSYTTTSYRPQIKSILAVTEVGDTISVPYKDFIRDRYDTYTRFNYNNNWYWNNWRYDNNWRWNQWWLYPNNRWNNNFNNYNSGTNIPYIKYNPKVKPKRRPTTQPRINNPRTRISTPRGSNQTRTRTTPNVQTRTNSGRNSSGGNRGSNGGKRNQ